MCKYRRDIHHAQSIEAEVYNKGESLIRDMERENEFDIIFFDIELGSTTGVELGKKIKIELKKQGNKNNYNKVKKWI